jgi:transposase-like protein
MKKLIAAVTTAGLLIVGTAGVASAADSTTTTKAPAATSGKARRALGKGRLVAAVKIAATTIGVEPKALGQEIKAGTSVADVAKSHNVDPQTVIDAIDAAADKKVDEAVTAGKIDATRAATIKEQVPTRVAKLVNGELKGKTAVKAKLRRHARRSGVKLAASTIGIDTKTLVDAVKGGQTVADVARSHNVDPQKVIDAIVSGADAKIQAAVTSGKISSTEGATLEHLVATNVPKLVNATLKQLGHRALVAGAVVVSAKTIGITPLVLHQALISGQSVAQVATAHGVSPTTVVHALVTAGNARIDKAVANHHLSADRAAKLKARLPKAAQHFVDATRNGAKTPAAAA